MPANYARRLLATQRSDAANRHLGYGLAFVAGSINAGGFVAVHQYTSHLTGMVSAMADSLTLGTVQVFWSSLAGLVSFLAGAVCTSWMVNASRRRQLRSIYASPLILEALLLIGFGLMGSQLERVHALFVPFTVMVLCFMMGLQNALITKISRAEIRTTHVTGLVTDIGIELGRRLNQRHAGKIEVLDQTRRSRLAMLCTLFAAFFLGGVAGSFGFQRLGYMATLPLAVALGVIAAISTIDNFGGPLKTNSSS